MSDGHQQMLAFEWAKVASAIPSHVRSPKTISSEDGSAKIPLLETVGKEVMYYM